MNPEDMTDDAITAELIEIDARRDPLLAERSRRRALADLDARIEGALAERFAATGYVEGDEWVRPTGYHDAYPLGWRVTHDGKEWESLRAGNPDEPGAVASSWREIVPDGAPPPEWQRPQAHNPYMTGDRVTFEGAVWVSLVDNNAWSPAEYPAGWELEEATT